MYDYKLYIFDIDGTLVPFEEGYTPNAPQEYLPNVEEWFNNNLDKKVAFATNQGEVGLRYWMETADFGEPEKYPTEEQAEKKYYGIAMFLSGDRDPHIEMCYRYQTKKGKWSPVPSGREDEPAWKLTHRKPNTGMIEDIISEYDFSRRHICFVGDSEEDLQAASKAKINFVYASVFFRRKPDVVS